MRRRNSFCSASLEVFWDNIAPPDTIMYMACKIMLIYIQKGLRYQAFIMMDSAITMVLMLSTRRRSGTIKTFSATDVLLFR